MKAVPAWFSRELFFGSPDPNWGRRVLGLDSRNLGLDGNGIVVTVLDTGIDRNNAALRISAARSFVEDEAPADCDDDYGHGTFVSGLIAGQANEIGPSGISPGVQLLMARIGRFNATTQSFDNDLAGALVKGLNWAIASNSDIVNLSVEFVTLSSGQRAAIEEALISAKRSGIVIVCASGNGSTSVSFPASSTQVLSVGAVGSLEQTPLEAMRWRSPDSELYVPRFSNYGTDLDLLAPGVRIVSNLPMRQGSYGWQQGTSVAAPFVTGLCALLMQADSHRRVRSGSYVDRIYSTVKSTAKVLINCPQAFQGGGVANADRALSAIINLL